MSDALPPAPSVRPGTLQAFAGKMLSLEDPRLVYDAGDILRRDGVCEQRGRFHLDDGRYEQPGEMFGACAGAALYRREAVLALGGFDERYFAYLEDVDLALRLALAGWRCRYEPAVCRHAGEGSSAALAGATTTWSRATPSIWSPRRFPSAGGRWSPTASLHGPGMRGERGGWAGICAGWRRRRRCWWPRSASGARCGPRRWCRSSRWSSSGRSAGRASAAIAPSAAPAPPTERRTRRLRPASRYASRPACESSERNARTSLWACSASMLQRSLSRAASCPTLAPRASSSHSSMPEWLTETYSERQA